MITIVWTGDKVDVINTPPNCFMFFIDALYHCGDLPPNYPLPAILNQVEPWDFIDYYLFCASQEQVRMACISYAGY